MMQQSKKAVLVIDDDPVWRKLYEDILRGEFALVSASSEEDAGQKIAAQDPPFHVVVTDVRLKDWEKENRGGLNVIFQNIRVKGDYTNTIVITGYDTEDTAFQAKEFLQAYAYLLKTPDVAAFDYKQFRKLVREAAEDAEKKRGISRICIIEENDDLRENMKNVLSRRYTVQTFATPDDFFNEQNKPTQGVVCLNANLLSKNAKVVEQLRQDAPDLKIILMTDPQTAAIIRAIRNHSIEYAISLDADDFNEAQLQEDVRRSLASEETKYAAISIEGLRDDEPLQQGQAYTLTVTLYKDSLPGAIAIWLPQKATRTVLRVIVDAPNMSFRPEDRIFWEIPPYAVLPPDCRIEIVPQKAGAVTLTVDIEHGEFPLGRIEKRIFVKIG